VVFAANAPTLAEVEIDAKLGPHQVLGSPRLDF
jgi:hypothetical protein